MNLNFFLYIAAFFSLSLGEFGQYPFGQTQFSISATDILLTLAICTILIWNIGIKKNLKMPKVFFILAGFWAIGFFSLIFSFNFSGFLYLFRFIIYSSILYLTYSLIKSGIFSTGEFLNLLKITSLIIAILGLFQIIFFPDLEVLSLLGYDPHKNRLFSTFLDPNYTGTFLSFSLIFMVYELLTVKFKSFKTFFNENRLNLISASILFLSIILTFSRSAYLMLFSALFILLTLKRKMLLVPLFLIPFILYLIFPPFTQRLNGIWDIDKSASERFYSWEKGLIIFQKNPVLGVGFNNIRDYSQSLNLIQSFTPDGGNSGAGIDSSLIFILATTGIIGILAISGFLGKIYFSLITSVFIKKKEFNLPILAIFTGLLLNSFFINSLFFPPVMFLFYSILGIYLAQG